ncbi:MAG: Hpt domain-containing protein [Caulobacteraceae bacterium]
MKEVPLLGDLALSPMDAPRGAPSAGARLRIGGMGIDPEAVARAEAALKSLSANFAQWLADEIAKLGQARARIDHEGFTPETMEGLYMRAHDLKGLGTTYEYPIITRFAGSLCKFTDDPDARMKAPLVLIDEHIAAIRIAASEEIRTEDDPRGRAVAEALEAKVAALPV